MQLYLLLSPPTHLPTHPPEKRRGQSIDRHGRCHIGQNTKGKLGEYPDQRTDRQMSTGLALDN